MPFDLNGECTQFPSQVRASIEYFDQEDAYLIENGMVAFIWIGQRVPSEWLLEVFNAKSLDRLDTEKVGRSLNSLIPSISALPPGARQSHRQCHPPPARRH